MCDDVGFADKNTLLKHELAYVLGQMGNVDALPILESVVEDLKQHPMVRHEVRFVAHSLSIAHS